MGWYLKKSFGFGPLRINLSKSGIGASVGVAGLRVSAGPKGRQLNAGREGLYYRKSLNTAAERPAAEPVQADAKSKGDEHLQNGLLSSHFWRGFFGRLVRGRR